MLGVHYTKDVPRLGAISRVCLTPCYARGTWYQLRDVWELFPGVFKRVWLNVILSIHCTKDDLELFQGHFQQVWLHVIPAPGDTLCQNDLELFQGHFPTSLTSGFASTSGTSYQLLQRYIQRYIISITPPILIYTRLQLWKLESEFWCDYWPFLGFSMPRHASGTLYQTPCFIIWKEFYCDILYDTDCISSDVSLLSPRQGHGASFTLFLRSIWEHGFSMTMSCF